MNDIKAEKMAQEAGFVTAWIHPAEIPVNSEFVKYCEENRCGKYGGNYSCPPDCGTSEEMHQSLLAAEKVMVLQSIWEVPDYGTPEVMESKVGHNKKINDLRNRLLKEGYQVFAAGYGGCTLCDPCKKAENKPCAFPEKRMSCLSAYCIDVGKLAEKCGLPFDWDPKKLHLFGLIMF